MHQLRRNALRSGEEVRIERELHDELRLRAPRELRVEDFVTEGTEIRRTLDTPQDPDDDDEFAAMIDRIKAIPARVS